MAALAVNQIVDAGTKPSFVAASTSDTAPIGSGKDTVLVYRNTGTQKTVTVSVPGNTAWGAATLDNIQTLGATTGELWIPLRKDYDPGDGSGRATVTMSPDATGVTVSVVRVG